MQYRPDYPSVGDPSFPSPPALAGYAGTDVSALEPYTPPNVPHGLPHVVRFATLSSMDLPLEVRFLIIMLARFADVNGVASVAAATLCEICRIGSHHTIDRWLGLGRRRGNTKEGTRAGRQGPEKQLLHLPGPRKKLEVAAGGPSGHQPHRGPGPSPPSHRGPGKPAGQDS